MAAWERVSLNALPPVRPSPWYWLVGRHDGNRDRYLAVVILAACAIDELGKPVAEATFANDPDGHIAVIAWARSTAPGATVGMAA